MGIGKKLKDRDAMEKIDQNFLQEMKKKLDVDILGAAAVEGSNFKELRNQAVFLLPGAKSVVVFGKEIFKEVLALLGPSKGGGEAEPGELFGPHSDYLNARLTKAVYDLHALFRKEGFRSFPLPAAGCPTDQRFLKSLFSYKHAAQIAGLGTIGRHSMLITPEFGPRVRLACLLTEVPVEPSPPLGKDYCFNCQACIQACPAQALQSPAPGEAYSMNKFACRTYRQAGLTCSVCLKACAEVLDQ
jgi:epoxyqueuosine reductase